MRVSESKNPGRRAGALFAVAVVMATLVACGGSKSPNNPSPTPAPTPAPAPTSRTTQNPLGSSTNVEARTSQVATNGASAQVFDDFTFTGGANIRSVAWQGIYCAEVANGAAPAPTATGFIVSFYADQSGRPNTATPLHQTTFPLGQVAETLDRTQASLNCGTTPTTWSFYSYSVTLPTAFGAAAGTRYWVSVQAMTPTTAVFWGWRDGTPDNRTSLQLFQGNFTTFAVDRAYSLAP